MVTNAKPGDRVWYQLWRGSPINRWIPAIVQSVGPKRIVIVDELHGLRRIVKPSSLADQEPPTNDPTTIPAADAS